jgi:general stress protein 26
MEWSDVVPHLTGPAHLATVTVDHRPHVAKVSPAIDGEVIWVATRSTSGKARNIGATGRAAMMWEPRSEAYVWADAEVVTTPEIKQRLWQSGLFAFPLASFFGSPDREDFVLIRLTPTSATVLTHAESGIRRDVWRRDHPV